MFPALVCLAVGIHFFPLRRLFAVPIYNWTGSALCLVALTTFVVAPATGWSTLWTLLPGSEAALVLSATCAVLTRACLRAPNRGHHG